MSTPAKQPIAIGTATQLLKLAGITPCRGTIQRLVHRLESCPDWFDSALAWLCVEREGDDLALLLDGNGKLPRLPELKERSKLLLSHSASDEEVDRGLLGYAMIIAAGRAHFGRHLGSRSEQEMVEMFIELSASVPRPWSELFSRAAGAAVAER